MAAAIAHGTVQSAAQHFVLHGYTEPRVINPAINLGQYLNANPDVAASGNSPYEHLLNYGVQEARDLGNGVALSDFSGDPVFAQLLATGDIEQALLRVKAVAPFFPDFQRPDGWAPGTDAFIPVDFLPPAGSSLRLVVPSEVMVPDGLVLSDDVFDVPHDGGDGGGGTPEAFTVMWDAATHMITFGGTETGPINLTTDGTHLIFTRGGIEATNQPAIADVAVSGITAVPGVTMTAATLVTPHLAATLADGAATLGAVTSDQAGLIGHLAKVKANGITAITLSNTEFDAADAASLNAAIADGALQINGADVDATISAVAYTKALEIRAGAGNNTIDGGAGDDIIYSGNGENAINGGDGDDVFVYTDNVQLRGDSQVLGDAGVNTIRFTLEIDTLHGGSQGSNFHADFSKVRNVERIELFGSNHINLGDVFPIAGIKTIVLGDGETTLRYDNAAVGTITVDAAALADGKDLVLNEFIVATAGHRFDIVNLKGDIQAAGLTYGSISVTAAAGSGFGVYIQSGNGNDTLTGSEGDDTIDGGKGDDTIDGGKGNDTIIGGGGNDVITGGAGADQISLVATRLGNTVAHGTAVTLITSAADSFVTTVSTLANTADTVFISDVAAVALNNYSITLKTGVAATSIAAATTVNLGTTTVAANGFLLVNAAGTTTGQTTNAVLYQDTNGNGIIEAGEFATNIQYDASVGTADTYAITIVGGAAQIQVDYVV
ncbi:hypothetical protein [Castellaniella sp.]|uniref:beta strand repeat-containing protein n=1 Tax=Castellaniella sp. TaxID=1955812 RepID=UPI002B0013FA|nr:hypothetical protein [Castellaniella sp.]